MARLNGLLASGVFINTKFRKWVSLFIKVFTSDRALWIGSPVLLLLLWEGIARSGMVESYILPAPSVIFQTTFSLLASGELLPHIYFSLFRALTGFVIGSIAGILLGLMMGWSKFVNNVADIPFNVFRAVPKSALISLFIVWFGLGEFPKILLLALSSFVLCTVNTMAGVRSVDATMIKAARTLGAKDKDIIKEVVIPAATPMIFASLRLGVVVSLVMLVIVEMMAADKGLGFLIKDAQHLFLTDRMFAGIIAIAILGYTLDRIVRKVETRALRWHQGIASSQGSAL